MDFYVISACQSNSGKDWRVIDHVLCTKENAIYKAKTFYLTGKWSNVYVALDNMDTHTIIWDAGHDEISGFAWD